MHVREVLRRAFLLNRTFSLDLDPNLIYAIAAYHDIGKHINSDRHELISAQIFQNDPKMSKYFSPTDCQRITEAIADHCHSKSNPPRSTYGKLISSADRNARLEMVFMRSFFVGKDRQPNTKIADFLDSNFRRLKRRYDERDPENMFYPDQEYKNFLTEIRTLLRDKNAFNERYRMVNNISSRDHTLAEEPGAKILPIILF